MGKGKVKIPTKPNSNYPMGKMLLELGWSQPEHSMDTWKSPIRKKGIKREDGDGRTISYRSRGNR